MCRPQRLRVFIYPNDAFDAVSRDMSPGKPGSAFGFDEPWCFSNQRPSRLSGLIHQRLMHYRSSPEEADLFFYFQLPYQPPYHNWTRADRASMEALGPEDTTYMGNDERLAMINSCHEQCVEPRELQRKLVERTALNAHRHAIVPHFHWTECAQEGSKGRVPPPHLAQLILQLNVDGLSEGELTPNYPLVSLVPRTGSQGLESAF